MPDMFDGGLMGSFYNPQTAGLLGMAQGLLAASAPSRLPVSNGQALGMGLQGMQQGVNTGVQMQQNMLKMRAMQGLLGGDSAPQQTQPQQAPTSLLGVPSNPAGGLLSPTLAQSVPQPNPQAPAPQSPGASIYGRTPQQLFQQGMLMNMAGIQGGGDLMKIAVDHDPTLAAMMPTDITKMGVQAGMSPQEIQAANRGGVSKATYIAPVNARPGAILRDPMTMQPRAFNPNVPTGGTPVFDASGNVVAINSLPGAATVESQISAAKAAGEGSALPYSGVDANGNPLPITNRTAAATGGTGIPAPLRNNNPGALMPGGRLAQYPDMTSGLSAMDANLSNYGKQGVNTLSGIISKWAPPNENDTQAYISDVSKRLGIGPNQRVDLTNPAQRQAISTAIMLHENGPQAVFGGGAAQAPGAMYAQPPMGAATAANASQGAPSKQMADAYSSLSGADANYQQSREALTEMMDLANNKGLGGAIVGSALPENISTRLSPDAAKYQKLHATYVALQGKALGSGGTDAARATIDEAVPTYDKPQSAMVSGLGTQLNNLDISHVKTQFLTPIYQRGDEKAFTQQSAAFDQNIKPSMAPILMMNGPQQRAAVQAAIKANPSLRANFEWAFNNGLLK
jgi:hypothetical protein